VKIDPAWTLWPEHMRKAGWHTVYSGKWHVAGTPRSNGFVETAGLFSSGGAPAGVKATFPKTPTGREVTGYTGWTFKSPENQPLPELGVGLTPDTDRIMADRAVEAIGRLGDKRFFMEVAFTAPHDPLHWPAGHADEFDYRGAPLPKNFRTVPEFDTGNINGRDEKVVPAPRTADEVKKERAIYFSQVQNIDRQVGRLVRALEAAGQLEHTIIIFTSDHGLALGSHGLMGKQNQYEHTINVPLILSGPGIPAGRRFESQCCLRDLYPTVCELAGLPIPESVEGRSLRAALRGEKTEVHDAVFGYFTDTQRMIRGPDGWKLIWYPKIGRLELFQVKEDPDELRDRAAEPEQRERVKQMNEQLGAWLRVHNDPALLSR
jgi:arylsulfatase A-like enzyme